MRIRYVVLTVPVVACGTGETPDPGGRAEAVAGYAQCTPAPRPGGALPGPHRQGYPLATVDRLAIRALLTDRRFPELDALLSAYADSAWRDFRLEYRALDAFNAFDVADPRLTPFLDEFVTAVAESPAPYLARATHRIELGWQARGARYARETTPQQFQRMGDYLARAVSDIAATDSIAPCSFMSFYLRMRITQAAGAVAASETTLVRGLDVYPYSFLLRLKHMYNLAPRWGGSYAEMVRLASAADSLLGINPKLQALKGFTAWDRGRIAWSRGDSAGALAEFNDALIQSFFWEFALERGELFYRTGQYPDALRDLTYVLEERPYHVDALYWRARTHYAIGRVSQGEIRAQHHRAAFRDIEMAAVLDPMDDDVRRSRDFYREQIPEFAPTATAR